MRVVEIAKKLFFNLPVFIITFIVISLICDIYYLYQNTDPRETGKKGWTGLSDLKVYWVASRNLSHYAVKGEDRKNYTVYDKNESFYHFRYSPFIAFSFMPFAALMRPATVFMLWSILINIIFLFTIFLFVKIFSRDFKTEKSENYIIIWAMFFGTLKYYLMNLAQGQMNIIVTLLFVLFLICYLKNREFLSGIIFSLIIQMKPLFVGMLIYYLLKKRFKLVVVAAVSTICFVFIPACVLGFDGALELVKGWFAISTMSVPSQLLDYKNQSFVYAIVIQAFKVGWIKRVVSAELLSYSLSIFFTAVFYAMLFLLPKKQNETRFRYFELSMLIFAALLFSPLSWGAYYIHLIIPIALAAYFTFKDKEKMPYFIFFSLYMLLTSVYGTDFTKFIPGVNKLHFIHISIGTLFLFFLLILGYKRNKLVNANGR